MRPVNKEEEGDQIVQKISSNSVSILDHIFTFDSVADTVSTQQDIFHLVGLPLVENCLAGFNSSIFAYGQTGSGKTYTMWGPPSALSEDESVGKERGLTPRVFERLFTRINEEQVKHSDKQLNYQCRCSFLEIYNEQITDLLDPNQKNLQIREDVRTGVYVDYLTEEYVCSTKDVLHLLMKGLANRRTGATSINAESSRSHCVFTCVVESRLKSIADGLSSLRTSRINLVDLAGSERQKLTGAAGERLKEAGNINRSLSQLGNLINILAEVSQSGKQRHIPYRDSKLTFLLQESLGGNAKLAMICAISPSQSCKSETFSTLRFAQGAKAIQNQAVVNEITQDDVNVLREQIRQLKDELLRMKSNGTSAENNGSYSTGWNARRSLNLLRMSLNRSALPVVKDDSDEEMEINDEDVEKPCMETGALPTPDEGQPLGQLENLKEVSSCSKYHLVLGDAEPMQISGSDFVSDQACESMEVHAEKHDFVELEECKSIKTLDDDPAVGIDAEKTLVTPYCNLLSSGPLEEKTYEPPDCTVSGDHKDAMGTIASSQSASASSLSIVPYETSSVLQPPSLSISPRVESCSRKSLRTSLSTSASQKHILQNVNSDCEALNLSFAGSLNHKLVSDLIVPQTKNSISSTEHLEASLHRGLQIIDSHQHSSPLRRSSFRFSMAVTPIKTTSIGIQTSSPELEMAEDSASFICDFCKNKMPPLEDKDIIAGVDLQLVPIEGSNSSDKPKKQVPKAVKKVLAGAIRREMAIEDQCAKQATEIMQLNRLVQQYKHERECNAIIEQIREDKISRLEGLMDGIIPIEEFREEEVISLTNEHKLLKEKYDNHPEVLRVNIELKRVQKELDGYRNFFDMGERDVLMEEIQDLRTQLQYYIDSSSASNRKFSPLLHLMHSIEPISAPLNTISELPEENVNEKIEQERLLWLEAESKWISLSEELRIELETSRSLAEKRKLELDSEKKCAEELKEALQTAMQGHARILEQYAELQEKHIALLARHRKISDGIADVKRAAAKAGVRGAESKFIDSLAAEISTLKAEREKERRYWRDENKGLQAQLRDTAEAVQAAGELLVRLKEAEEAAAIAQKRSLMAEQETEKAYQEIEMLKKNYDRQILLLNQFVVESRLPKEAMQPQLVEADVAKFDRGESPTDQRWREEFEPFCEGVDNEFSKGTEPYSWYSDYDRCNI